MARINIIDYPGPDLTGWKKNDRLRELRICSRRLERLTGVRLFRGLQSLDLFRCRKLCSLSEIAGSTTLRKVELDKCPGISDLAPLSNLSDLRELIIKDCGNIKSVAPLAGCKRLEFLQIARNTTILDGDLSPLKILPNLKDVLLARRKHYSHSGEELQKNEGG